MKTFREAYGVLSDHAQTLRNQQEPNIDDLLTIVTESVAAYKVCKERIDAVEVALAKALGEPAVVGDAATTSPSLQREGGSDMNRTRTTAPSARDGLDDTDDDTWRA